MKNKYQFSTLALALGVVALLAPEFAHAQALDEFGVRMCEIVTAMTGSVGQAVATLGVVFLGIGAFFGKVNWGLTLIVAAGVVAIFGAGAIVSSISSQTEC